MMFIPNWPYILVNVIRSFYFTDWMLNGDVVKISYPRQWRTLLNSSRCIRITYMRFKEFCTIVYRKNRQNLTKCIIVQGKKNNFWLEAASFIAVGTVGNFLYWILEKRSSFHHSILSLSLVYTLKLHCDLQYFSKPMTPVCCMPFDYFW